MSRQPLVVEFEGRTDAWWRAVAHEGLILRRALEAILTREAGAKTAD